MQALLAADACDAAVLEILGPEVEYALSRKPNEDHVACLTLSDGEEASSPGASPALAVIGALALALSIRASKPRLKLVQTGRASQSCDPCPPISPAS
jgi:hypothetical protein